MLKESFQCIWLSVILIDSVFRTGKNYYPQLFSEECKYIVIEKRMPKCVTDGFKISSDHENSNEDYSDEENPDEENHSKE